MAAWELAWERFIFLAEPWWAGVLWSAPSAWGLDARESAGLRGEKVGEDVEEEEEAGEAAAEAFETRLAEDALGEWRFAMAAALAALLMGTWMPSEGSDNDLRRVLYGMMAAAARGLCDFLMPVGSPSSFLFCFSFLAGPRMVCNVECLDGVQDWAVLGYGLESQGRVYLWHYGYVHCGSRIAAAAAAATATRDTHKSDTDGRFESWAWIISNPSKRASQVEDAPVAASSVPGSSVGAWKGEG